jgi:hypothetical protein
MRTDRVLWLAERLALTPTGCYEWQHATTPSGYGVLRDAERGVVYAHRFVYEALVGPIPEGLTLDHLCRNPACVRPEHLQPSSVRENILRGTSPSARNARASRCIQGHPFDAENTYWNPNGSRCCRACRRERKRRYRQAQRSGRSR